ncbi:SNF2 DNA helicase [Spraguea lophii 42_110]|uniref:Chromatin-remodeling ATPase INO80 n=1 Tax=Spraguea lophii (strain 42_110) TaxID=1358809 RepID=S7XVP4_SPRLO|nr:SNF2 DNA helicase [Spraguea lophii 42_110]
MHNHIHNGIDTSDINKSKEGNNNGTGDNNMNVKDSIKNNNYIDNKNNNHRIEDNKVDNDLNSKINKKIKKNINKISDTQSKECNKLNMIQKSSDTNKYENSINKMEINKNDNQDISMEYNPDNSKRQKISKRVKKNKIAKDMNSSFDDLNFNKEKLNSGMCLDDKDISNMEYKANFDCLLSYGELIYGDIKLPKNDDNIMNCSRDELMIYNRVKNIIKDIQMGYNEKKVEVKNDNKIEEVVVMAESYDMVYKNIMVKQLARNFRLLRTCASGIKGFCKKVGSLCARELRRGYSRTSKTNPYLKGRKIGKELNMLRKKIQRSGEQEIINNKKVEKMKYEKKRKEQDEKEVERQKRKLNFLINQTEIFSHFMKNKDKLKKEGIKIEDGIETEGTDILPKDVAYQAALKQIEHTSHFESHTTKPVSNKKYFDCQLMEHQEQGLKWLISLYNQGINGILADDMGLGKTVQTIAFLCHLIEKENIDDPFLIVTPASTIGNWHNEFKKFTKKDSLKIIEYYGSLNERKLMRKKYLSKYTDINVVITSYQIVVADEKPLQKHKWQYMILDEAQAIKSSSSIRWKVLLRMNCRNRLLLTGTPIQNNMQELWSLLHFIMPTLFDSHEEFSEWFSKDIEKGSNKINQEQLNKLHNILKPFMLRREKKDINLNVKKIEKDIIVDMSSRQQKLYQRIEKEAKININDINENYYINDDYNYEIDNANKEDNIIDTEIQFKPEVKQNLDNINTAQLHNTLMQLRKVCNHPDLFQRLEIDTPYNFTKMTSYQEGIRKQLLNKIDYSINDKIIINRLTDNHINYNISNNINNNKNNSVCDKYNYYYNFNKHKGKEYNIKKNENDTNIIINKDTNMKNNNDTITYNRNINFISNINQNLNNNYNNYKNFIIKKDKSTINRIISASATLNNYMKPTLQFIPKVLHTNTLPINYFIIPRLDRFISDSGKLTILDKLLPHLVSENHKILIYFQMTRMIDLVEDYLIRRKHQYLRLDGGVRVSARKDLVKQFQSNDDIKIFLLSTRAGGVGINLTAADTVIFYDSDWNPTVDQQAMDRAHRLGQKKDVTVYRLICRNTVEEKVIESAQKKGEIQRMVIEGGEFKHDM